MIKNKLGSQLKIGGFVILSILIISSVTAISNKDRIIELLTDYEEECIEYKYEDIVHYKLTCIYHTDYGFERRTCLIDDWNDDWKLPQQERIVEKIKTNECLKWHLVRYK